MLLPGLPPQTRELCSVVVFSCWCESVVGNNTQSLLLFVVLVLLFPPICANPRTHGRKAHPHSSWIGSRSLPNMDGGRSISRGASGTRAERLAEKVFATFWWRQARYAGRPGQLRAKTACVARPATAKIGPISANVRPESAQVRPNLARIRSNFGYVEPGSGETPKQKNDVMLRITAGFAPKR